MREYGSEKRRRLGTVHVGLSHLFPGADTQDGVEDMDSSTSNREAKVTMAANEESQSLSGNPKNDSVLRRKSILFRTAVLSWIVTILALIISLVSTVALAVISVILSIVTPLIPSIVPTITATCTRNRTVAQQSTNNQPTIERKSRRQSPTCKCYHANLNQPPAWK